jgi:hypothetical protein
MNPKFPAKVISIFICLTLFSPIFSLAANISTCEDLQDMRSNLDLDYVLIKNIDCSNTSTDDSVWSSEVGFKPVGNRTNSPHNEFTGTFDGKGFNITNLFIYDTALDYAGLFGLVSNGANIANVSLIDINVTGRDFVGGLVGFSWYSTIDNSYVMGSVTGTNYVGGLVGKNGDSQDWSFFDHPTINNSYATGNVTGEDGVGGLAGANEDYATIDNSYATGNVTGEDTVGGLVGGNSASITNSYWYDRSQGLDCYDGGNENCTAITDESYFYNSSNSPMDVWDFDSIWADFCDDVGYPPLQWQGINDEGECSSGGDGEDEPYCGDGTCDAGETCSNCPGDCGRCRSSRRDECSRDSDCSSGVCYRGDCVECAKDSDCDDGNPCTDQECWANSCRYSFNTDSCDDGDSCTSNDRCSQGLCSGTPIDCDDGDSCTRDECVDGQCVHTDICPEPQACSASWSCSPWGSCVSGLQSRDCSCSCEDNACIGDSSESRACEMPPDQGSDETPTGAASGAGDQDSTAITDSPKSPQGDSSWLWILVAVIAIAGIVFFLWTKKPSSS